MAKVKPNWSIEQINIHNMLHRIAWSGFRMTVKSEGVVVYTKTIKSMSYNVGRDSIRVFNTAIHGYKNCKFVFEIGLAHLELDENTLLETTLSMNGITVPITVHASLNNPKIIFKVASV